MLAHVYMHSNLHTLPTWETPSGWLRRWEEDEVNRSLDRKMTECFAEIWQVLPDELISWQRAAAWQSVASPPHNQGLQHV